MCADPEIASAINVTDITQTSVRVSWSNGQTHVVSSTSVYYKATGATWSPVRHSSQTTTTRTVPGLESGTEYQFYVKITSYGKSSTSNTVTITTGKIRLAMDMKFLIVLRKHIAYLFSTFSFLCFYTF